MSEEADEDGHWIASVLEVDNVPVILQNIYGYKIDHDNRNLLHQITTIITEFTANFPTDHIIVGGDFLVNGWMDEWMAFTKGKRN